MGRQTSDKKDTFKDEEGTHLIKPVGKEERLRRANERKKKQKRRRQQAKASRGSETGTEGRGLPSLSNQAQPEDGGPDEWSALDTGHADDDYTTEPVDSVILEYGKRASTRAMKEAEFLTRKADFVRSYIRSQSGLAQDHDHSCHPQAKKDVTVTVVDLIDVQEKVFTICGCSPFDIQLLEANCMTSSMDNPGVSFTTRCLEFYRQLNLKGQLSSQVFSKTLNAILSAKKDLYRSFLQSFKWYRAIKSASEQTDKVQFSICPVCPPFDNIHLSLDACFGLRRRMKAGDSQSFIPDDTYCDPKSVFQFADATANQSASRDRSDCHDFQAEKQANRTYKSTDYLSEKGVMGLFCARHGFLLRMCDVFHGERFAYADYLLTDFLRGNGLTPEGLQQESRKIMLYYDIGCRYRPHLTNTELGDFPFVFLIPKFHVYAHGMSCLKEYHPASIKGAGHTDGETCERAWSYLGRFARITREMSSGNRFDQLSDAKTHYNYTLLSGSLKLMSKKLIQIEPTIVSAISTLDAYRGNMTHTFFLPSRRPASHR